MLNRGKGVIVFYIVLATVGSVIAGPTNLVTNGSFELGYPTSTLNWRTVYPSYNGTSYELPGWTVVQAIDCIGYNWPASDGTRSLDMSATSAGIIQQVINTTPGGRYQLSFDMAGNWSPDYQGIMKLRVWLDSTSQTYTFNTTGRYSSGNMGWVTNRWLFTAGSSTTTLKFESLNDSAAGPALDNVVLTPVPVPGALFLGGLGVAAIGWIRTRRSMQG
jgi:choice-of-anchor C domain-containing protein